MTGSVDRPLNAEGRADAQDLKARAAGADRVFAAPNDRSMETARTVHPKAEAADWLEPWKLGAHEGKPLDSERDAINDRILNRPDESPGVSPHSGEPGESFDAVRERLLKGANEQAQTRKPGESILNITSGRALQIIDAAGDPAKIAAADREFAKPGELFRREDGRLKPAARVDAPGQYFATHGAHDWNASETGKERPNGPERQQPRPGRERTAIHGAAPAGAGPRSGETTEVLIPGETRSITARYEVRELSELQPSHIGETFAANPRYELHNERDYSKPENQQRVIANSSENQFDPRYHVTDNPDMANGPILIDDAGNAIGGNSRAMILQRVYGRGGGSAQAYRTLLEKKAAQFGLDPEAVRAMRQPVLVRVASDESLEALPGGAKWAVRKTNVSGTAALSASERAAADAGQTTPDMLSYIAAAIENAGAGATLNDALAGRTGTTIVNRLIAEGFFNEQERPALMDGKTGALTQAAKDRISKAMLGQFFRDSDQIARTPPAIKNKLERIAAPLAKVAGNLEWDITPDVREAVDLIEYAGAHGIRNLGDVIAQAGMFGEAPAWSEGAVRIAGMLRDEKPNDVVAAFRTYVNSKEPTMFGESTAAEAFRETFDAEKPGRGTAAPPATRTFEGRQQRPEPGREERSGERGAISPELLTLGAKQFWESDVAPAIGGAARGIVESADDILKVLAPTLRDKSSQQAGYILRNNLSELARRTDRAKAALERAKRAFNRLTPEQNYEFIRRVEARENQQTPELQAIAAVLREMLDRRRRDVQALGTGKLQRFYENYFPHVWADPKRAANVFATFFGRRPLEGGKSFLKQRTHVTFEDGLAAGLKPVSDNPVDLVLLKVREMDKFLMAHETLNDWKESKLAVYVDARTGKTPRGWQKIADPIGTVYGPSIQQIGEYPNEGLWEGLSATARALGLTHERGFLKLGSAIGRAHKAGGKIETLHGTAEDTLAHEIGHQIDWLAGSGKRFVLEYPDAATVARLKRAYKALKPESGSTLEERRGAREELKSLKGAIAQRKEFAKQLRALADLRQGEKSYIRSRQEKMAQLAQMWVGSRELFERTAPKVFDEWKRFLEENPKLHALRDTEGSANKTAIQQPYDVGGLVIRGSWHAPEGAARILNNYLSPGLRDRSGIFRALLGVNNVLNQFQLGMSAFHLGFASIDTTVSKAALGYEALFRGKPLAAARFFAETPAAAFTTFLKGDRMLKEWYSPGSQGGAIAKLVDELVVGGGRARMDQMYRTQIAERMMQALRAGNVIGAALRAPFAGVEAVSNLIMDQVVPRMKLGAFADMARFHLENMPEDATFEDVQRVLTQDWNSIENRLGEMTYDNLFWHRAAKDLAMLSTRSVGFTLGTLREIGGGLGDVVAQPVNALRGKPVNLNRLSYLLGMVTVNAAMSAIYQKLKTGKGPEELEDYIFPKNGETDEHGRPQRVSWPTYMKDVYHYATAPVKTLEGKVAPIWSSFAEMIHNRDFYGTEIRNPDDPLVEQLRELAEEAGKQFVPIAVRNYNRETALGGSAATRGEQFVGITPAPADLNEGPGEKLAREISASASGDEPRTREAAERRDLRQGLTRSLAAGKGVTADAIAAKRAGTLSKRDLEESFRAARETSLQRSFSRLGIADAVRVYNHASRSERKQLQAMLLKKARAAVKEEGPAQKAETLAKVRAAIAGAP